MPSADKSAGTTAKPTKLRLKLLSCLLIPVSCYSILNTQHSTIPNILFPVSPDFLIPCSSSCFLILKSQISHLNTNSINRIEIRTGRSARFLAEKIETKRKLVAALGVDDNVANLVGIGIGNHPLIESKTKNGRNQL